HPRPTALPYTTPFRSPLRDPALQQGDVVAFHHLEAAAEIGGDPAADEGQALGHLAALVAEMAIDRLGVLVAVGLDDHEQHGDTPDRKSTRLNSSHQII